MAQFFKAKPVNTTKNKLLKNIQIEKLDHQGRGIAIFDKKPLFIDGALKNEHLDVQIIENKKRFSKGIIKKILVSSPQRISPACPHYDECGGCHLQHCNTASQRKIKESGLSDLFKRFAKQEKVVLEDVLFGSDWAYRRTARFGLQFNKKTKTLSMGFRKKGTNELVDQKVCPVLRTELDVLITPLKNLLNQLQSKAMLGHIELIVAEQGVVILLRHLKSLNENDTQLIKTFSNIHKLSFYVQSNSKEVTCLAGEERLTYQLPQWDCTFNFHPTDFLQVNESVNQKMVAQALNWLDLNKDDHVLDLFCGLGNFTLPIARATKQVIGVEGIQTMVDRAANNAQLNNIDNALFYQADLSDEKLTQSQWSKDKFSKVLLDPARAGAYECMPFIIKMKPTHIVYVSCDPVTLARDSQLLLDAGYRLDKLGLLDMFPQTAHMESIALFKNKSERSEKSI